MSSKGTHLTEWTLEQLAEGSLSGRGRAEAASHVESCRRCASELEAYRALVVALEGLPRFAPSADFGDAVMERVRIAPATSPVLARLQQWLPSTRRGWTMLSVALAAPGLPVVALVVWLLSNPLVSPSSLWQWTSLQAKEGTQALLAQVLTWGSASGLFERAQGVYSALADVPMTTLGLTLGILAVAIPLSAWSLLRLTRTPMGSVTYAN